MIFCQITVQEWSPVKILSEYEKTTRKQKSCDLNFFKNTDLFLECVSVLLPGVAERSELASVVAIATCASKEK